MLLLAKLKSRIACLIQVSAAFNGLLATIWVSALLGCGQAQHSGIGSASEYGYAAETPERRNAVIRRFEGAASLLRKAGLETRSLQAAKEKRELTFAGKEIDGNLELTTPDTGLASIVLKFQMVSSRPTGSQEGQRLLAELQKVLAPSTAAPEHVAKAQ